MGFPITMLHLCSHLPLFLQFDGSGSGVSETVKPTTTVQSAVIPLNSDDENEDIILVGSGKCS